MYSQESVLALVELIYGAAGDPARWTEVLEQISLLFQGAVGTIHHQDTASQDSNFATLWNLEPEAVVPYTTYYGAVNPYMTTRPRLIRTGAVNTSQMLCPDEIFIRSEYYNDYLRKLDLCHCIAATLRSEGANSSNVSIFRSTHAEPFGDEECRLLFALVPHLQRAFQLHSRIQGLECRADALGEVLDQLQHGVILLDAKGHVLLVNQAATALLAREKALKLTPRGLTAAVPSENKRLNQFIQGALTTGNRRGILPGGSLAVSRIGSGRPLHLLVTPLRTASLHLGKKAPVAAIFISDPERKTFSESDTFARIYGLTTAEARLVQVLANGDNLKDAADQLSVAQSTVRSQLKSIFEKTNTNRQSQLVRLLLLVPAQNEKNRTVIRSGFEQKSQTH